ncbi:MAG: NADP-specific glutamate dehydrogenase, partial [Clostridia bacterium]|nr:NADP-specific glutamate dehydrogenase [Clostridia bacterium]
ELSRHIGSHIDVPAGDIGVGAREIGYLFGQYKRICNNFENAVLTGKGISYGGSLIRPEATGYGAVYFCNEVLKRWGEDIKGKTFAVSGFGNVAWGAVLKINQLGGKVLTISGPDGYVYDENGITEEKAAYMLEMRASGRDKVQDYADKFGAKFVAGEKPWGVKVDVVMPCATQNEVQLADAEKIVANGTKYYIEVSNMPTTDEAVEYLKKNDVVIAPSKAVNAGGVAVSALEMSQNSMRLAWSREEVDEKLHGIMVNIYNNCSDAAKKYGKEGDLIAGANIAGFLKVAEAMMAQGIV